MNWLAAAVQAGDLPSIIGAICTGLATIIGVIFGGRSVVQSVVQKVVRAELRPLSAKVDELSVRVVALEGHLPERRHKR